MIIVSQEKDAILNFDNIEAIRLMQSKETNQRSLIAIDVLNGERYSVARYETEERAKEVLKQIYVAYGNMYMLMIPKVEIHEEISSNQMFKAICYEMPER